MRKEIRKTIKTRIKKDCVVCGNKIKVILYTDRSYRSGNYFGKIKVEKGYAEYWECSKCYW